MSDAHEHAFACRLTWTGATTSYAAYERTWVVDFDGKPSLVGSAAPIFRGDGARHNPEDLLVAALAACHFLSYAALCARRGVILLAYEDAATGAMSRDDGGVTRFTEVVLRPIATLADASDVSLALALHEPAHAECFIASSVNFPVRLEPSTRSR